jgi:hypothetical protein
MVTTTEDVVTTMTTIAEVDVTMMDVITITEVDVMTTTADVASVITIMVAVAMTTITDVVMTIMKDVADVTVMVRPMAQRIPSAFPTEVNTFTPSTHSPTISRLIVTFPFL